MFEKRNGDDYYTGPMEHLETFMAAQGLEFENAALHTKGVTVFIDLDYWGSGPTLEEAKRYAFAAFIEPSREDGQGIEPDFLEHIESKED